MEEGGNPNEVTQALQPQLNEEGLPINPEPVQPEVQEKIPPEILKDMQQLWSVFAMN